jgi:autophagy-related protein 9
MSFINNDLTYSNLLDELTSSPEVTNLKKHINSKFLKNIYLYYIKGGYYNILISNAIDILTIIFVGMFILTTFIFLDWKNIILCGKIPDKNFKDCGEIANYLSNENIYNPNFFQVLILIFVIGILFSSIYKCVNLYNILTNFYKVDRYYTEVLKIPRKYLHSKSWEDIILNISNANNILSIDDITTIILKEENFFISFIDNNMFGISNSYFTKQLEYNLYYGLNPSKLVGKDIFFIKNRLILLGFLNIIFSPFILFYIIISFIFYNIDELYNNKKVFGPRRYTHYFKWKIRHYNELDHYFDDRINISMKYANEYTKQFPSIMIENIAKFISFISGAFIVLFLLFSIFDENILIYVKFLDRSLIFYTGIIGTISAISRSFITEPENSIYNPNAIMEKITKYTLYYPISWKDNAHTIVVKNEFLSFYNYILVNFFYEIIGVITTPYLLIFHISKQNKVMEDFLKHNVIFKKNIGNICLCSDFKSKKTNEKLTTSIMSFSENYPFWKK